LDIEILRRPGATLLILLLVQAAAACTSDRCGSGAETGDLAVRSYLHAVASGDDQLACQVLARHIEPTNGKAWANRLIASVGGPASIDALQIVELRREQMGAEHVFAIRDGSDEVAQVVVGEREGRFTVVTTASTMDAARF
jgi:hypothetical protein